MMEKTYTLISSETMIRQTYKVNDAGSLDLLTEGLRAQGWRQVAAVRNSDDPFEIIARFEIEITSAKN